MGRQTLKAVIAGVAFIFMALVPGSVAQAPTLQEQLAAQYKVVKMGSDTSGYSVVEAGTLLAIQKGGILAVPYTDQSVLTTKYEGGAVHSPSALLTKGNRLRDEAIREGTDDPLVPGGRQSLSVKN